MPTPMRRLGGNDGVSVGVGGCAVRLVGRREAVRAD